MQLNVFIIIKPTLAWPSRQKTMDETRPKTRRPAWQRDFFRASTNWQLFS